jgi:SPP1 family predicted phage head-tail adaptor
MYDGVATLMAYGKTTYDQYGNETTKTTKTEVFVQPRGVYASEFYNAAQIGLKPSVTLFVSNREDYSGQKVLIYEGKEYDVIRVDWSAQRDGISLICEERVNSGG